MPSMRGPAGLGLQDRSAFKQTDDRGFPGFRGAPVLGLPGSIPQDRVRRGKPHGKAVVAGGGAIGGAPGNRGNR